MKTSGSRAILVAVVLAATALFAVACGDDDEAASAGTTATDFAQTIVDVAASNPDFSILVAAVQEADLVDTLSGPGPFTVFAPTNDAFEAALTATNLTQEELLASPDLAKILTYHVLSDEVMAADITGTTEVTTVEGSPLTVELDGTTVKVGPTATVTQADVPASNGVIHAIDAVLLPPDVTLGK